MEQRKNHRPEFHGHLMQKQYLLGPLTWEGHEKKCVERYCELANKNDSTILQKFQPSIYRRKLDLSENCSQFTDKLF